MATKLIQTKEVSRELECTVMDKGTRPIVVSVRGDGRIEVRAKGMKRVVVWSAPMLYERGIREGRVV